jgi:hypothetical protein
LYSKLDFTSDPFLFLALNRNPLKRPDLEDCIEFLGDNKRFCLKFIFHHDFNALERSHLSLDLNSSFNYNLMATFRNSTDSFGRFRTFEFSQNLQGLDSLHEMKIQHCLKNASFDGIETINSVLHKIKGHDPLRIQIDGSC